ncbi:MAG: transglycosylase domain-containing protein, partial [Chloroflexota bacterium]
LVFTLFVLVALTGFVGVVGAAFVYSQDLKHPSLLEQITFPEDTIIYDRHGSPLAKLSPGGERRRTIEWAEVPAHLADAVTAVEDKTFWANTGIDPIGITASLLDTLTGDPRGGSTITQQLVRQKLLPDEVIAESDGLADRKIKEIIQSVRVTDYYRGEEGKKRILTAYLNQNFYGNNSYGVLAAAKSYFNVHDLDQLSLAQAATLAAIPQAPGAYDLVRNAVKNDAGEWEVPTDSAIYQRRNLVLRLLADDPTRRVLSGSEYTTRDYLAAMSEPLVIIDQGQDRWKAPHFVWYVLDEVTEKLCGEAETCDAISHGGLRITTTLDLRVHNKAEKWVEATALLPHRKDPAAAARNLNVPYAGWMANLRDQNVWNAALSAIDYQTGEIIAYVGSANYYERAKVSKKMQPQYDVLSQGWRQSGSTFKPFTYATGINDRTLTAATMFMDVTTDFGGYTPTDFTAYERGPLRLRDALQLSLNVPAVKALSLVGQQKVFDSAQAFGMDFQQDSPPGLSMALGTLEVHPLDLNQAYATLANGGVNVGHTSILRIRSVNPDNPVEDYDYRTPKGKRVLGAQAAYVVTDILKGNTDPSENGVWSDYVQISARNGQRRPAALKTGTSNDAKDLNAYGYLAPPSRQGRRNGEYALAVGVWAGNSNGSPVTTVSDPVFSLDVAAPLWDAFVTDVTRSWEVRDFARPSGLSTRSVDAWTGHVPSPHSRQQYGELFITGTAPTTDPYIRSMQVIKGDDGTWYRWHESCEGTPRTRGYLALAGAESHTSSWNDAVKGWIRRARKGTGVGANVSPTKTTYTAYFYAPYYQPYGSSWGGDFPPTTSCRKMPQADPSPEPTVEPSPEPSLSPAPETSPGPGEPAEPTPEPEPVRTPRPTPKPTVTPEPTEAPTERPQPTPGPTPRPEPTVEPTPEATRPPETSGESSPEPAAQAATAAPAADAQAPEGEEPPAD